MTDATLDAQYRGQVERWWSPQTLIEIRRLLCMVAPLYRETGEHSAVEMSPKDQVSWLCQEIARLKAEMDALELYGDHTSGCPRSTLIGIPKRGALCTCGFDAARKAGEER